MFCFINLLFFFLDPGNDALPFTATIDVSQLINIEDVMENCDLGPNGALVYCMEYLEKNLDWFFAQVGPYVNSDHYFLFDLPGQVFKLSLFFVIHNLMICGFVM